MTPKQAVQLRKMRNYDNIEKNGGKKQAEALTAQAAHFPRSTIGAIEAALLPPKSPWSFAPVSLWVSRTSFEWHRGCSWSRRHRCRRHRPAFHFERPEGKGAFRRVRERHSPMFIRLTAI